MTDDRWLRVKRLFEAKVDQPHAERSAFVAATVADDETLRSDVDALLAADRGNLALSDQWPVASESLLAELRTKSQAPGSGGLPTPWARAVGICLRMGVRLTGAGA